MKCNKKTIDNPAYLERMETFGFNMPEDSEPEPDLEFKTCLLHFFNPQSTGDSELIRGQGMHIEKWLNDGWQIDDKIICPPFVMCVLSREKEAPE